MKLFTSRESTVKVRYPSLTFESIIQVIKNFQKKLGAMLFLRLIVYVLSYT